MPVYNPPVHLLRSAVDSVRHQIYPNWELCIADDCSTDSDVRQLMDEYAASDERIKVVMRAENGHISTASNSALSIATGLWVAPVDHDDILADHALALVALSMSEHQDVGLFYSDEDKIDEAGQRRDPFFKPDFDPLLLNGQNYISHLSVFRKDLVDQVGGYREGYEGSQDWDLTLRVSENLRPDQVVHIPHVLYHWRLHSNSTAALVSAKPYAIEAGERAVQDHLNRIGGSGRVVRVGRLGHNRVCWTLPEPAPQVTIVVPTRDGRLLQRCVDSVLDFTTYPNFEVVVVDNSSRTFPTLSWLQGHDDRLTVIRDERPFNFRAQQPHGGTNLERAGVPPERRHGSDLGGLAHRDGGSASPARRCGSGGQAALRRRPRSARRGGSRSHGNRRARSSDERSSVKWLFRQPSDCSPDVCSDGRMCCGAP